MLARPGVAGLALVVTVSVVTLQTPPSLPMVLLGALTAVALYLLELRWGVWPWLAAVVSIPALLSALPELAVPGQHPARDSAFVLLATLATLCACWRSTRWLVTASGCVALVVTAVGWMWVGPAAPTGWGTGRVLWVIGPCLAAAAALGVGRARGSGMRAVVTLTGLLPLLVLLGGVGSPGPTQPGGVLALAWWPVAGSLGLTAIVRGRRGRATSRPQLDDHDIRALADVRSRYPDLALSRLVVVIAAYNEASGLPAVLDELPRTVSGLGVDILVVDDGSTDATAEIVASHGRAHLVLSGVNRGQGAALRLGYRVARDHGARYIVTTDADGQYDPADVATVLAPVLDGSADFVTGSRRLGGQETRDRVRRLGVHVFAWAVSALTGHWSTDTSFGLRAMRAAVTAAVTLNQPQYQSSELLIGVLSHGYRVVEVPGRMRVRSAGSSKKGRNLVYGSRYARVVVGTWWREGCPAPVRDRAPALRGRVSPAPLRQADRA